jgi:hypothetical protein
MRRGLYPGLMAEETSTGRYGPATGEVERLLADARVVGPSGIERIAWAWKRYEEPGMTAVNEALVKARAAIEAAGLERAWRAAEDDIRAMTEGHHAQTAWRAESGAVGRSAEDAALHAALGLLARPHIDHETYRELVKTMSEALPWLLPEERPDQYRERRR